MASFKGDLKNFRDTVNLIKASIMGESPYAYCQVKLSIFKDFFTGDLINFLESRGFINLWDLMLISQNEFISRYRLTISGMDVVDDAFEACFLMDLILENFELSFYPASTEGAVDRELNTLNIISFKLRRNMHPKLRSNNEVN
jgi:hypothetical protein